MVETVQSYILIIVIKKSDAERVGKSRRGWEEHSWSIIFSRIVLWQGQTAPLQSADYWI